jgi:hypothetical protein
MRNPNLNISPRRVAFLSPDIVKHIRALVAAAGGDPAMVPDIPFRLIPPAETAEMLGDISLSTLYRKVQDGTLPKPIAVDRGRPLPLKHSESTTA